MSTMLKALFLHYRQGAGFWRI